MKRRFALMLLVGLLLVTAPVSARKWTSSDGKFSVEAELVEAKDGNVRLKRQDGKVITVPVSKLSKADQDHLSSIAKPEKKPEAVKKLTPEQVKEILAYEIGQWESKGQFKPADGAPQDVREKMEVRWKEKGRSIQIQGQRLGTPVTYVGSKEYDPSRSIFILKYQEGDMPEQVAHQHYDPAARTFRSKTDLAENRRLETTHERIDKNTWRWTLQVFDSDRLVFTSELLASRQP
ncbi:MAG: SHD1 domain-containing protein [Pirellulales bacterium]